MSFEKRKVVLKNIIYGMAVADAFGYCVEFDRWEEIKRKYGDSGFSFKQFEGDFIVSDDTQMMLFCLSGLLNYRDYCRKENLLMENPENFIFLAFKDWYLTQTTVSQREHGLLKFGELFFNRAAGNTCLSSLMGGKMGTVKNKLNDSKGCGGLMRVMPIAFFADNLREAFEWGAKQAAITHGHPSGYLSAGFYAGIIFEMLSGKDLISATNAVLGLLSYYPDNQEVLEAVNAALWISETESGLKNIGLNKSFGEGWVAEEALALALFCALTSISFEEVVEKASNHNGDSDSVAMLAAGLWLLDRGMVVNGAYVEKIDVINPINYLLEKV